MKDEKLKGKGTTRLAYTGLLGGLEHLKIETRLIIVDEMFASVILDVLAVREGSESCAHLGREVYLQQNKKRRSSRDNRVTLKL